MEQPSGHVPLQMTYNSALDLPALQIPRIYIMPNSSISYRGAAFPRIQMYTERMLEAVWATGTCSYQLFPGSSGLDLTPRGPRENH